MENITHGVQNRKKGKGVQKRKPKKNGRKNKNASYNNYKWAKYSFGRKSL